MKQQRIISSLIEGEIVHPTYDIISVIKWQVRGLINNFSSIAIEPDQRGARLLAFALIIGIDPEVAEYINITTRHSIAE